MAVFDWLQSFLDGLSARDWINAAGFFSTPMICIWFFPNLRALAAGVVITAGFWMFWAVRTGQDLPFVLVSTVVVALICGVLCFGVLSLRRSFPSAAKEHASAVDDREV